MQRLIKLKKSISANIALRESILYSKDLKTAECGVTDNDKSLLKEDENLHINYYAEPPYELLKAIDPDLISSNAKGSACLLALHNDIPAGCLLLNTNGEARLLDPFRHKFLLGQGHAYGHCLFVKNEFRSKGIAKLIYLKSFEYLKEKYGCLDVFVDAKKLIPNLTVQRLGFERRKSVALIRFFRLKLCLNLNTQIKITLFRCFCGFSKSAFSFVKISLGPLAKALRKTLLLKDDYVMHLYNISKNTENGKITLAYLSKGIYEKVIFNKIFSGDYDIEKIKTFPRKNLLPEFTAASKEADIVIADGEFKRLYPGLSRQNGIKFIPQWVVQKNSAFNGLDGFTKRDYRSAYEDIRTSKKHNYGYLFTRSMRMLDFFYENIYLPFVDSRFNQEKINTTFSKMKQDFKKGGLLLLEDKDRYIGGSVIEIKDKTIHPIYTGVLNGDLGLLKKDALVALYYIYFKFAQDRGLKIIDLGLSRGFLDDGVLRYKSKWDTQIEFDKKRSNVFALKICNLNERTKNFLINNPFISIEKDGLTGNIFLDTSDPINHDEISKRYLLKGIDKLNIQSLTGKREKNNDTNALSCSFRNHHKKLGCNAASK